MQVLPVIVPYIQTTSNIAISCKSLWVWLSNNGFPIKSTKKICLENLAFYTLLENPDLNNWTTNRFTDAIIIDDSDRLKSLLDNGADIEAKGCYVETALIFAAENGKVECLKILLEYKANIEAKDYYGRTALIWAARFGRTDCLKILLDRGANTEVNSNAGSTALSAAVIYGRTDCIKILLQFGAKVEPYLREKFPQYAELWENCPDTGCLVCETECLEILLRNGAKVGPWIRKQYPQYSALLGRFYSLSQN